MQQEISKTVSQVNLVVAQTKKMLSDFQHAHKVEQIDIDLLKKRVIELYDIVMTLKTEGFGSFSVSDSTENEVVESEKEEDPKAENKNVDGRANISDEKLNTEVSVQEENDKKQVIVSTEHEEDSACAEEDQNELMDNEETVDLEPKYGEDQEVGRNDGNFEEEIIAKDEQEEVEKIAEEAERVVATRSVADILGKVIGRPTFSIAPKQSIAESMEVGGNSIGERLAREQLSAVGEKPIKDIKSALDINDKLMLTRELFDNNGDKFNRAISILNGFGNKGEALFFLESLKKEQNWNDGMEGFIKLKTIIERKRY